MLSSGMCLVTKRLLFLGSRVGDSLLVVTEAEGRLPARRRCCRRRRRRNARLAKPSPRSPRPPRRSPPLTPTTRTSSKRCSTARVKAAPRGKAADVVAADSDAVKEGEGDGVGGVSAATLKAAAKAANAGRKEDPGIHVHRA